MSAVDTMGASSFSSALDQGLARAPDTIKEESCESRGAVLLTVAHDEHIKLVSADSAIGTMSAPHLFFPSLDSCHMSTTIGASIAY